MSSDKRAKLEPSEEYATARLPTRSDLELENLLLNYDDEIDWKAIKKMVQKNPHAAMAKYLYHNPDNYSSYVDPIHLLCIAIQSNAPVDVVDFIYKAFPEAAREKGKADDNAMHLVCKHDQPFALAKSLLDRKAGHELLQQKNFYGQLPLHIAVTSSSSFTEIVPLCALLLDAYPEALEEVDNHGSTPLFLACNCVAPSNVISLLLEKYPAAAKISDRDGWLPLHSLCNRRSSLDAVSLLLKAYPGSVDVKCVDMRTPVDVWEDRRYHNFDDETDSEALIMLSGIRQIIQKKNISESEVRQIMSEFCTIHWYDGVLLALDLLPPSAVQIFVERIGISVVPVLISVVGHHCKMTTMWNILKSNQDVLTIS